MTTTRLKYALLLAALAAVCTLAPATALAGSALRYLKEERKVEALVDKVRRADVALSAEDREDIATLLAKGGVRAALLGKEED